jgi:hypothetical protein
VVRLFSVNETWGRTLRPVALTAVALALSGPAQAHDYSVDIICRVTEIDGNQSAWSCSKYHERRRLAGVDVHRNVLSRSRQVCCEPSGLATGLGDDPEPARRHDLAAAERPRLVARCFEPCATTAGGYATLLHNGVLIGVGQCAQRTVPTAATVGDVAPE